MIAYNKLTAAAEWGRSACQGGRPGKCDTRLRACRRIGKSDSRVRCWRPYRLTSRSSPVHTSSRSPRELPSVQYSDQEIRNAILAASRSESGSTDTPRRSSCFSSCYFAPVGERSIAISLSVYVCVSVPEHISGTAGPIFTNLLCLSRVPWLGRPLVALRYVMYSRFCG